MGAIFLEKRYYGAVWRERDADVGSVAFIVEEVDLSDVLAQNVVMILLTFIIIFLYLTD